LIRLRSEITKALELARADKVIGHPLEAEVSIAASEEQAGFIRDHWEALKEISIVSEMQLVDTLDAGAYMSEEIGGLSISVLPAPGVKCERCWTRSTSVGRHIDHPLICTRCHGVVQSLNLEAESSA
jgi:isoleucyl-tRNA synthetase